MNWTNPVSLLRPRKSGFDDWGAMAPTVVVEDGALLIFYTGLDVHREPCFTGGTLLRFGKPVHNGAWCVFSNIGRAVAHLPARFPG